MANRVVADAIDDPLALGRALQRLDAAERRWHVGDVPVGMAARCIVQPFVLGFVASILSTHPNHKRRMARLERVVGAEAGAVSKERAAEAEWERRRRGLAAAHQFVSRYEPQDFLVWFRSSLSAANASWGAFAGRVVKPSSSAATDSSRSPTKGAVYITTVRAVIAGPAARTVWRWQKLYDFGWRADVHGGDAIVLALSNRQKSSGI